MTSLRRYPGFLKIHNLESRLDKGLPVIRKGAVKPDKLRGEVPPRRVDALLLLKVREGPLIGGAAVVGYRGTAGRKAGVREDGDDVSAGTQDPEEGSHCPRQVRSVHQNVVRND